MLWSLTALMLSSLFSQTYSNLVGLSRAPHLVLGRFMAPKGLPNRLEPRDIEGELEEFVSSLAWKLHDANVEFFKTQDDSQYLPWGICHSWGSACLGHWPRSCWCWSRCWSRPSSRTCACWGCGRWRGPPWSPPDVTLFTVHTVYTRMTRFLSYFCLPLLIITSGRVTWDLWPLTMNAGIKSIFRGSQIIICSLMAHFTVDNCGMLWMYDALWIFLTGPTR